MTKDSVISDLITQMITPRRIVRPELASRPAWAERATLETARGPLVYTRAGSGPVVLLVHGWEGTHADLDAFVEPLIARGYGVVTFDNHAHGESGGETATLPQLGDGVLAVGAQVGPLAGIVAHSVGGPAAALALRDGLVAERIALVSTPTRYLDFVRGFAAATNVPLEPLVAEITALGVDLEELDLPTLAMGQTIPALLVHSSDDRVTAVAGSERVAEVWPGSRFVRVEGLGHYRILRDPQTIATVVDFMRRDKRTGCAVSMTAV